MPEKDKRFRQKIWALIAGIGVIVALFSDFFGVLDGLGKLHPNEKRMDIEGKWDEKKATKIATKAMIEQGGAEEFGFTWADLGSPMQHELIGFYSIDYGGKPAMLGVFSSRPENHDCHGCGVSLSIFRFAKNEKGWVLEESRIGTIETGAWGQVVGEINVYSIGYNRYGIFNDFGFTQHGESIQLLFIYTFIADDFKQVLRYNHSKFFRDERYKDEIYQQFSFSHFEIIQNGDNFYDLKFYLTEEGNENNMIEQIFKFNGIEYNLFLGRKHEDWGNEEE